jgi:hypothetical protein
LKSLTLFKFFPDFNSLPSPRGGIKVKVGKVSRSMGRTIRLIVTTAFLTGLIACNTGDAHNSTAAAGSISVTNSMGTARAAHTATLLANGKVLIAGGMESETNTLSTAELYDPGDGRFHSAGNMTTKRVGHKAVLLRTGKVLILGGSNREDGALDSAELYDPATGTFSPTGNMKEKGAGNEATLLADGRVLITGGYNGKFLRTAELYDPVSGTFAFTGRMNRPTPNTATLLTNGKVLLTGGGTYSLSREVFRNAELYDPATGTFTPTSNMITSRNKYGAALLPNGDVLITGGTNEQGRHGLAQTEIYDSAKGTFRVTANMSSSRYKLHDALVALPNGKIVVAGGAQSVEVYDPATDTFSPASGSIDEARYFATATLLQSGNVLITGGYKSGIVSTASAWLYQPKVSE